MAQRCKIAQFQSQGRKKNMKEAVEFGCREEGEKKRRYVLFFGQISIAMQCSIENANATGNLFLRQVRLWFHLEIPLAVYFC